MMIGKGRFIMKKIKIVVFVLLLIPFGLILYARIHFPAVPVAAVFETEQPTPPVNTPEVSQPSPADTPEVTQPPAVEPGTFVISAVGDCTLASSDNYVKSAYGYAAKMNGDYAYPFSNTVQYFADDDFTIANLECVLSDRSLTPSYMSMFHFKSPTEWANILIEGGVDFVTTANNHLMVDYGSSGAEETYEALETYGIPYGKEGEANIVTSDSGLVLGIYCDYNSFHPDKDKAADAIKQLKDDGAQYIICMFHWGNEMYYSPTDESQELAKACIDAGANLVYGSHSHCLQPIEEYKGGIILYSMGNWSFGGNTTPRDPDTAIVQITVSRASDGSVSNEGITIIPCEISSQPYVKGTNYNDYRPTPYEEDSEEYLRVMSKLDGSFEPDREGTDYSAVWQQRSQ